MIFTENNKKLSMVICGYEFPQHKTLKNEYDCDANWLNCEFRYSENDYVNSCVDPCLSTYELAELINGLSDITVGSKTSYHSDFLEPYLEIDIESVEDKIKFKIQFEYDSTGDGQSWEIVSLVGMEQAIKILEELKEFQCAYPVR